MAPESILLVLQLPIWQNDARASHVTSRATLIGWQHALPTTLVERPCRSVSHQAANRHDGCGSCVSTISTFLGDIARTESPLLGDLMLPLSRNLLKSRLTEEIGWSYQKSLL